MIRIALLSEKYTPDVGGLAISTERLAGLLASAGYQVHVFTPTHHLPAPEAATVHANGVRVTRVGAHKRTDDTLVTWFETLVREHQQAPFDVLHGYYLAQAGFLTAYAGNYVGLPSVVSARGNDLERAIFDPARASHVLYALEQADAVTTNAKELARKASALVPGRTVTVIPNGVDPLRFQPLPRNNALAQSLNLHNQGQGSATSAVIGFAGELRAKKGLRPLLSAYAQINRRRPCTLLIAGDIRPGEDRQVFDEFQRSHSEAKIIVTGFIPQRDLPAYYALMDVFVQPSLRDGLPNALLEAMACGKAVIATRAGGILDVVTDCENGRLVSVSDAEELATITEALLENEQLRQRFGQAACQTIRHRFTLQAELNGNLDVYRRLGLKV